MTIKNIENITRIKPMQLIMLFFLLQISIAMLTDGFGFSFDEAMWQYIGHNWFRNGLSPYHGGVDNKSPLIFAVFGISDKLFGVNYWFPRILGTVCQSVGLYFAYRIAKQIAGERTGILALTFYGLSLLWRSTGSKYVSYTETYAITCIIISVYKFFTARHDRDYFWCGLIAGVGAAVRFSAFFGIGAIFIATARKNFRSSLIFLSGIVAGLGMFVLFLYLSGINVQDFLVYAVTDNFGHGSATDHSLLWKIESLLDKFFYSELILFYPMLIGYFFITKKIDVFAIWLICEFIGINIIGIYDRVHLKDFLPAFSIMSAITVNYLLETYKISLKQCMIIIWITFFPKVVEPLVGLKKLFRPPPDKSENYCREPGLHLDEDSKRKLGLWIKANTTNETSVLIAGMAAQIQVYSERLSPSIYFNATQTDRAKKIFWNDINMNKPAMIAIPLFADYVQYIGADMREGIQRLVMREYKLDTCVYGYNIYTTSNYRNH